MAQLTSQLVVQLLDRATGPARGIANAIRGIGQSTREANRVPVSFGERINAAITRNDRALARARGGLVDAVAGYYMLRTAIGAPLKAAMDFEDAMADVKKVADFPTPESFEEYRTGLMELSRLVPVALNDLATISASAAEAGFRGDDILKVTEAAAKIGVAFGVSAEAAGDALPHMINGMKLTLDESILLSDAINHLSNNMASGAPKVLDFITAVGADAGAFGFTAEQAAAIGSAMIASGFDADVAATSFRNMGRALTRGASATGRQATALKTLGLDATEVAESMQHDAVATTMMVLEKLGELPAEQRAAYMSDLFGNEARALAPLMGNLDLLRSALGLVADEAEYAGSAYSEFDARNQTFSANLQRFNNRIEQLKVSIGNSLLPILTQLLDRISPVVSKFAEFSEAHPKLIGRILATVAGLVSFRVAIAALKFAGLLGKGGALSLLALGFKTLAGSSTAAAVAVEASNARIIRSMGLLSALKFASPLAAAYVGLGIKPTGDATVSPELRDLMDRDPGALDRASALDMNAVPAGLPPDVTAAMELVQKYRANGGLPTEDMIAGLGDRARDLRAEIAGLQQQIDGLADNPKAASIVPPLEGEMRARQRELAGVEDEISTAERAADDLGAALALIGKTDVTPTINTTSLDRAVEQALTLQQTLRGLPAASPSTPRIPFGARAHGGPVSPGRAYMVGEEGPELITPRRSGYVHPSGAKGGGAQVTVSQVFHIAGVGGADAAAIEASVRKAMNDEVRETFQGIFADTGIRFA